MPKDTEYQSRDFKVVGTRPVRPDGIDKVTGKARYGADMTAPGMLWGMILRSPHAHARIKGIDTSAAAAMKGVKAVITRADFTYQPDDSGLADILDNSMAGEKAMYDGHAVAAVAATSKSIARAALKAIKVDYEVLPAVIDPEVATQGQPALVHEAFENNLAVPYVPGGTGFDAEAGTVDNSAVDKAFAEADFTLSQRMMNQRLAPTATTPFQKTKG